MDSVGRVIVVGVVGSAGELDAELEETCRRLGDGLMRAGFRLVTGGCGGVMQAVSRGARESEAWVEGRILGIIPSYRRAEANPYCDIVIPTGMQHARNVLVVSTADVIVAVDGGAGTLSEMALAWQLKRPIIALGDSGWAGKLGGARLDARRDNAIVPATTAEEAIRMSAELVVGRPEVADIGSGRRRES